MKKDQEQEEFNGRPILRRGPFPVTLTLADLRQAHRLSQVGVAKTLGVDQGVISRRERAGNHLVVSTLQDYARALGCECQIVFVSKLGHRFTIDLDTNGVSEEEQQEPVRPKRLRRAR